MPVTSLSRQRRRDTRSCGCGGVVAVVGAEGDDTLAPAPVVGPRCQLVSMPWNPDTGSNKPQGTNIFYDRSGVLSPVFASVRLFRLAF